MKSAYKLLIVLSVALVLAFAISFSPRAQLKASSAGGRVVLSQCTPCHINLDVFRNPRIVFKHAVHFERGIKCDKCHTEYPHQPAGTLRVDMYLCYNCHGLSHSQQGLVAAGDCYLCHPKTFNLIPETHTPAWNSSLHKLVPKPQLKECMLCHKPQFCEQCHSSRGIEPLDPEIYKYEGILPMPSEAEVFLDKSTPVVLSKCNPCHLDLEAFKVPGLIFKHGVHFEKGIKCANCHRKFPHTQSGTARVGMDICYGCHSLRHFDRGLIAKENCSLCHTPDFALKPQGHTAEFIAGKHKIQATQDRLNCLMCHKEEFCSQCHTTRKTTPANHLANKNTEKDWRRVHGANLRPEECSYCHEKKFCSDCHQSTMPHPVLWLAQHKDSAASEKADCSICHKERAYCSDCHHQLPQTTILAFNNCVRCHENYKKSILELVAERQRGLAVHRAHFEMTNTDPFECTTCHAQAYKKEAVAFADKGPYRFELCYSCHGRYRADKLIAKWGGSQLCYRCHPQR